MSCPPRSLSLRDLTAKTVKGPCLVARHPRYNRADSARHDGHMPQAQMCIDKFRILE